MAQITKGVERLSEVIEKDKDVREMKEPTCEDKRIIDRIVESVENPKEEKIRIMQLTQEAFKSLSNEHMRYLTKKIGVSYSDLYGIATFYHFFNLVPPGKHTITVCQGTACHVKGSERIISKLETLGIEMNGTTKDNRFSLKSVRCLGCCGLSPVMTVDEETFGRVRTSQLDGILKKYV